MEFAKLRNLSVAAKIRTFIILSTAGALVLASTVFIASEVFSFRDRMVQSVQTLSGFIAADYTSALLANDTEEASKALTPLYAIPSISYASIYGYAGTFLADYRTTPDGSKPADELTVPWLENFKSANQVQHHISQNSLEVVVPVFFNNRKIGIFFIRSSLDELHQRLLATLAITAAIFLLSLMVAYFISLRLERYLVSPIEQLVQAMAQLSASKNYSLRVRQESTDEIGQLVASFNDMLKQLQHHQGKLSIQNRLLEDTVTQRTTQLSISNKNLTEVNADLTREKEKAESTSDIKSVFFAKMSHELRTPVNGITGMTERLLASDPRPDQQPSLGTIARSADILLALINDVLDFSKIEAGMMEVSLAPFDLRTTAEDVLDLLAVTAYEKGVELIPVIDQNLSNQLRGDATRITQVITNLVGNAIKFTDQGEITLSIQILKEEGIVSQIEFAVKDTGIGIPHEAQKRIYDSFRQANSSTSRQYGGTGLGLSISKQLVEMMGGKLTLESEQGKGSTFSFILPLTITDPETILSQPAALEGQTILLLNHSKIQAQHLAEQLTEHQSVVIIASTVEEALNLPANSTEAAPFYAIIYDQSLATNQEVDLALLQEQTNLLIQLTSPLRSPSLDNDGSTQILPKPIHIKSLLRALDSNFDVPQPKLASSPLIHMGPRATILLAEDNKVNQDIAVGALQKLGYNYVVTENGEEAVSAFKQQIFDLVLLDCQMPVMDGYEAARQIRQHQQDCTTKTPIIALSANVESKNAMACEQTNMDDQLSKPYKVAQLGEKIDLWLHHNGVTQHPSTFPLIEQPTVSENSQHLLTLETTALKEIAGDDTIGNSELLDNIITTFGAEIPKLLQRLNQAINTMNREAIGREAHSLKSSSLALGGQKLSACCRVIEKGSQSTQEEQLKQQFSDCNKEYEFFTKELHSYLTEAKEARWTLTDMKLVER